MRAVASVVMNRVNAPGGEYAHRPRRYSQYHLSAISVCLCQHYRKRTAQSSEHLQHASGHIHFDIADWAIAGNRLPSLGSALFSPCHTRTFPAMSVFCHAYGDHCFYNPQTPTIKHDLRKESLQWICFMISRITGPVRSSLNLRPNALEEIENPRPPKSTADAQRDSTAEPRILRHLNFCRNAEWFRKDGIPVRHSSSRCIRRKATATSCVTCTFKFVNL